jgi:hypothetical protein
MPVRGPKRKGVHPGAECGTVAVVVLASELAAGVERRVSGAGTVAPRPPWAPGVPPAQPCSALALLRGAGGPER